MLFIVAIKRILLAEISSWQIASTAIYCYICYINQHFRTVPFMNETLHCLKCQSPYVYEDHGLFCCPECGHEWSETENSKDGNADDSKVVRDANGTVLKDGDTVTLIKDLKIKGSSGVVKVGTKVKDIRLVEGDHDIDCRVPGIGPMGLKSMFVKKVSE